MPEINIKVRDKCAEGEGVIICNNSDYTVVWGLDEEWTPYDTKTMRVNLADGTYQDVVFAGDNAALPVLTASGWVSVGLYAGDIHTTRAARLLALSSVLTPGGSPAAPAADVYAQIMAKLNELSTVSPEDIAKAVEDYLAEHPAASASMRVEGGYIQFSGDGKTWENVIALADLKGAPGSPGSPGSPGKDGLTPHIGDNGNWYLGDTDTGKPARGAPGAKGDPGKDGAGMDVTGATVDQTVKIAAVDDNGVPTAWKPVDMPAGVCGISQFRFIRKVIIPEDITTDTSGVNFSAQENGGAWFGFDTDENGNPFECTELLIVSCAGGNNSHQNCNFVINRAIPTYGGGGLSTKLNIGSNGNMVYSWSISHLMDTGESISYGATFGGGENNNVQSLAKALPINGDGNLKISKIASFASNQRGYGYLPGSWFTFYGR